MILGSFLDPKQKYNERKQYTALPPILSCHNPKILEQENATQRQSLGQHESNGDQYAGTPLSDMEWALPEKTSRHSLSSKAHSPGQPLRDLTNEHYEKNDQMPKENHLFDTGNTISDGERLCVDPTWDPRSPVRFPPRITQRYHQRDPFSSILTNRNRNRITIQHNASERDQQKNQVYLDSNVDIHYCRSHVCRQCKRRELELPQMASSFHPTRPPRPERKARRGQDPIFSSCCLLPQEALSTIPGWKASWFDLQHRHHGRRYDKSQRHCRDKSGNVFEAFLTHNWTKPWCWDYLEYVQDEERNGSTRVRADKQKSLQPRRALSTEKQTMSEQTDVGLHDGRANPVCLTNFGMEDRMELDESSIYSASSTDDDKDSLQASELGDQQKPDFQSFAFEMHPSDEHQEDSLVYSSTSLMYLSGDDEEEERDKTSASAKAEDNSASTTTEVVELHKAHETLKSLGANFSNAIVSEKDDDSSSWKGLFSIYDEDDDDHSSIPFDGLDEYFDTSERS